MYRHKYLSGSGSLNDTITPINACEFVEARLHLSAASTQTQDFIIVIQSVTDGKYNTELSKTAMNGVQDVIYRASNEDGIQLLTGDGLKFFWLNTVDAKDWGLEMIYRMI